ncbi:MAG TPA: class I SAM-dependent methyltransferase [Actinomycetota bacterium]|nr:class I SAM-dependent methyltransferase [Actinomycetota bacterium]
MGVIPFYGTERPDLFRIEREAMDRAGKVIDRLDALLPRLGATLDVGAGDGFTAERLQTPQRLVVALEPARNMRRPRKPLAWVGGEAEHLPFRDNAFEGAFSTWAYFFSRYIDVRPGLEELRRVVRAGGPVVVIENLGDDELSRFAQGDTSADQEFWTKQGFICEELETLFEFADQQEADALLSLYSGKEVKLGPKTLTYRVGLFLSEA